MFCRCYDDGGGDFGGFGGGGEIFTLTMVMKMALVFYSLSVIVE